VAQTVLVHAGIPFEDWSENVGYDAQGNLWVSRIQENLVQRYNNAGALTATVPVTAPGAIRLGPDGLMYVVYGDSALSVINGGGVVRFDPTAAAPTPEVFASGLSNLPNGAAFDTDGSLYVAASFAGIIRIRPDGTVDSNWSARAAILGADGIAIQDHTIYMTADLPPGQVISFPIADPQSRTILADVISIARPIPDFTDDMLIDPSGILYVATLSGQLVRIDPHAPTPCTVLKTEPMTSVAAIPGHPGEVVAGTELGDVLHIRLAN
jgi:sugar lactone lactonase YvrE